MRKLAPFRLETLLALLVEEVAGEKVVAAAILHVALALEIILANGALSGVGLLNSGRPTALVWSSAPCRGAWFDWSGTWTR